jgi:hypothetical protein
MSGTTGSTVECPVCGEEFDPSAAGGWCTNSECGEWRYEGADAPAPGADDTDDQQGAAGGGSAADATSSADEASEADDVDRESEDDPATEPETETETGAGAKPDPGRGDAGAGPDAAEVEPGAADESPGADTGSETATSDPETEPPADDETPAVACPDCGESVDADANFCPACGADVSDVEPGTEELTECPACGAGVDPDDSFCASCGEDLDDHRAEPEPLTECPDCGADVDEADSFCASCGEDLDAHRETGGATGETGRDDAGEEGTGPATEASAGEPAPETLVLETRGEEIAVADDDTVGRKLRRIVTETGGDEDEAVRIHREHVRFVREDGRFFVVDLGANPTTLNGKRLEKGDREPVGAGDTLGLSGVVELAVRRPE